QVVWDPRGVDLDVDSNNDGRIAEDDDPIEEKTDQPGVIVPVGGSRAKMIVDVPQGRTATLANNQGADQVRRWTAPTGGTAVPAAGTTIAGGAVQTYWIEAFAASASMADIAFTLTATGGSQTSSDTVLATAVETVVSIKAIDDEAHEQYRDTGTFVITRESGNRDHLVPVQMILTGDAEYGFHYETKPNLPDLAVGGTSRYTSINLLPGEDRVIVTFTPIRENRDNKPRKAVLQILPPQIPLYAVAKGSDKAEVTIIPDPQQGDLLITGRITYEGPTGIDGGTTLTLGALPVRGATVEIRDQSIDGDTLLATAYTDDNGTYEAWISSKDPTPGGGYVDPFVIVVAQSAPENIAVIAHEVSIPGETSPARKVFNNIMPRGPGRAVLDGGLSDTGAAVDRDTNAAFSVFDAIYSFSRYHVNLPGVTPGTVKARVRAPAGQNDTSEYSSGEIEVIRPDRFSWDTIGHEYGHFAHEHVGVQLGGGPHYLSENLRFHRGTSAWRLAFTDGFATYFSIVAQLRTPKPPSGVAGYGDTTYWNVDNLAVRGSTDIAAEGPSTPAGEGAVFGSLGEDNEVSVFRTLWDLYDPANNDPIGDIGDIGLWRLVTTGSAQAKPYFKSLYRDLITGVNIERSWDIGRVVADHKLVPAPLRVDLGGATTVSESIDHPPTFFISALYGADRLWVPGVKRPDQWLFRTVELRFYNSQGLRISVRGSTEIPKPANLPNDLPLEVSWTPTKDQWADIVRWSDEPIRWSVVATTDEIESTYESFSQTVKVK
ncbi:MAG: hypothetical protein ACK5SI_04460, partial [Planctomycetia bacterium]